MAAPLLMVVGAGPWQVATIRRARDMGIRVLATDGSAGRPGFAEADLCAVADITDPEATLAVARRHAVDGVLCDTTDNGVVAAAYVAAGLGLPGVGLEAARNCTDKARLTDCARRAGLRVPESALATTVEQSLAAARATRGPWVVKPVDNQSGRGVSVVSEPDQLEAALEVAFRSSRRRSVLIQEFVVGIEVIVDSLVCEGAVHVLGIATKVPFVDNPTVSARITYGAIGLPAVQANIVEVNDRLIHALGVRQGPVHAEYILSEGVPVPIDLAARGGGVHIYPVVLAHVSGVDVMGACIDMALGRPCVVQAQRRARAANIEFLRARPGRIIAIHGLDAARAVPGVALLHLNQQVGDDIGPLHSKDQRLGHIVTLADSVAAALAAGRRAARAVSVDVK